MDNANWSAAGTSVRDTREVPHSPPESWFQAKLPQYFTKFRCETAVIVYENTGVLAEDLLLQLNVLTRAKCALENDTYGISMLAFLYEKDFIEFLAKPVEVNGNVCVWRELCTRRELACRSEPRNFP